MTTLNWIQFPCEKEKLRSDYRDIDHMGHDFGVSNI